MKPFYSRAPVLLGVLCLAASPSFCLAAALKAAPPEAESQTTSSGEAQAAPRKHRQLFFDFNLEWVTLPGAGSLTYDKVSTWYNDYFGPVDLFGNPDGPAGNDTIGDGGFQAQAGVSVSNDKDDWRFGSGLGFYMGSYPALWESTVNYGGQQADLKLGYNILSVYGSVQYGVVPGELYLSFEPSLLIGFGYGTLTSQGYKVPSTVNFQSDGIGGEVALGAEWYFTPSLGLYMKERLRFLGLPDVLTYADSKSSTGYSTYTLPDGSSPSMPLSGAYTAVGVELRL